MGVSTAYVPQQPQPRPDPGAGPGAAPAAAPNPELPATPPYASEATRLLCAGTYLDSAYRDRVIDELYLGEQRLAAPSLGFDAARVRARPARTPTRTGRSAAILGLWVGAAAHPGLAVPLPRLRHPIRPAPGPRKPESLDDRRAFAFLLRWYGRTGSPCAPVTTVYVACGGGEDADRSVSSPSYYGGAYGSSGSTDLFDTLHEWVGVLGAWLTLAILALTGLFLAAQRSQVTRSLSAELSMERFPDAAGDPAEQAEGQRFRRWHSASGPSSGSRSSCTTRPARSAGPAPRTTPGCSPSNCAPTAPARSAR